MKNILLLKDLNNYYSDNMQKDRAESQLMVSELDLENPNLFAYGSTPYSTFKSLYDTIERKPKVSHSKMVEKIVAEFKKNQMFV